LANFDDLARGITKQLDVNDYSFSHLTLTLSLHYLAKFRSHILSIYNNEFIPGSACVDQDMINWTATNTSNSYYPSESHLCYITSFLLQHVLKMSSSSTNASCGHWHYSPTVHSVTADPGRVTRC